MLDVLRRVGVWSLLFLGLTLLPLVVAVVGPAPEGRSFWIEFGVGLGIIAFVLLGLQFATTARFRWIAAGFGSDAVIHFHRQAGILVLVLVFAHPIVLFIADPKYLEYLDPRVNFLRAVFLTAAMIGIVLVVVLPLVGLRFGLSYEWWRLTHGLFAAGVLLVGLAHALQVGHYVAGLVNQASWIVATGICFGLLLHTRVLRPLHMRKRPYTIVDVRHEPGQVVVLTFEPEGHRGLRFQAGQYVWLTVGDSPFSLQQHPFSMTSSAEHPEQLELAIKDLGDFTSEVQNVKPGTRAFLEGPYGALPMDPGAEAAVFVVGGIGVTPALSLLRTARDRGDRRPFVVLYGNLNRQEIAYRDALDELAEQLELKLVHVLSDPADDWDGESGYITREVLDRQLAHLEGRDVQYFVCGPTPMMDLVEKALLARGVPRWRLLSERFDFIS